MKNEWILKQILAFVDINPRINIHYISTREKKAALIRY